MQEPPAALSIMGGSFVEGGDGMARYAWVRLSVLCHLASCWDGELSRRSLLEGNCVWFLVVRSMQRQMPAIKASDGHHLMAERI